MKRHSVISWNSNQPGITEATVTRAAGERTARSDQLHDLVPQHRLRAPDARLFPFVIDRPAVRPPSHIKQLTFRSDRPLAQPAVDLVTQAGYDLEYRLGCDAVRLLAAPVLRVVGPPQDELVLRLSRCALGSGFVCPVDGWWSAFLRSGIALRFMPDLVRRSSSFLRSSSTRALGRV